MDCLTRESAAAFSVRFTPGIHFSGGPLTTFFTRMILRWCPSKGCPILDLTISHSLLKYPTSQEPILFSKNRQHSLRTKNGQKKK